MLYLPSIKGHSSEAVKGEVLGIAHPSELNTDGSNSASGSDLAGKTTNIATIPTAMQIIVRISSFHFCVYVKGGYQYFGA
jgi:hypothetical protein